MHAIVLAAGEGSRLRPLTGTKPKPMIRVANKPILQYCLEALAANGVTDVTMVVGYHREKVQTYFGNGGRFGLDIKYEFQEALLGTAHALAATGPHDEDFLVLGGDNIVDARLIADVLDAKDGITLASTQSDNPSKYGVLTLEGERVLALEEQPATATTSHVNTGVYMFPAAFSAFLDEQVAGGVMGLSHVLQNALERGDDVRAVRTRGTWMDALYPWDLLSLNARLLTGVTAREGDATVHPSTVIEAGSAIGEGASIGANTVIEACTAIGTDAVIGPGCVIQNSIIHDGVQLGPGSIVQDSIIGEGTRTGPRFTALSGPSEVRVRDGWHALDRFGCVIGEDCLIGGATTVTPGVLVGNQSRVGSGLKLSGNAPDGATLV